MEIPDPIGSCDTRRSWNIWMKTLTIFVWSKGVSNSSEYSWGSWIELACERTWLSGVDSWSHSFGHVAGANLDLETLTTTVKDLGTRGWKSVSLEFSFSFCIWHLPIRITKCKNVTEVILSVFKIRSTLSDTLPMTRILFDEGIRWHVKNREKYDTKYLENQP